MHFPARGGGLRSFSGLVRGSCESAAFFPQLLLAVEAPHEGETVLQKFGAVRVF